MWHLRQEHGTHVSEDCVSPPNIFTNGCWTLELLFANCLLSYDLSLCPWHDTESGLATCLIGLIEPGIKLALHQLFQVLMPDLFLVVHIEGALSSV